MKNSYSNALVLHEVRCPLCQSILPSDYELLYPANFNVEQLTAATFSARRIPDKVHYQLVKCKNDGLVRSTPVMDPKILSTLYQKSEFNYDAEVENLSETYLLVLEKVLKKLKPESRILEVGCGSGFLLDKLRRKGFRQVYGVEPSKDAYRKAPSLVRSHISNAVFAATLFPNKKFDFIFLFQTMDHIPDPSLFLKDCYSLLKPGGYILSFHHNVESFYSHLFGEKYPIFDVEHTFLYANQTSAAMFESQGFLTQEIFSPQNKLSLNHLSRLFPFPLIIKKNILNFFNALPALNVSFFLELGNTCIISQKPSQ